jgi:predicted glycosyltransferase
MSSRGVRRSAATGVWAGRNASPRPKRVALYSPDSFGLGHLRRTLLIAEELRTRPEIGDMLILTGSPVAQRFALPGRTDIVTLPAITKDASGRYMSRSLKLPLEQMLRLRGSITGEALAGFGPDLLLVDHAPTGLGGELRPVLARYHSVLDRPHLVLGMREIIDEVSSVRSEWERLGGFDAIEHWYDRVLVYGDPSVRTTAQELDLDQLAPGAVSHVGYLARPMPPRSSAHAGDLPMVLVTVGGGSDGEILLDRYAANLATLGPDAGFRSVVLTGPLLDPLRRDALAARFSAIGCPVEMVDFTDHPEEYMRRAAAVITMGGYNSVIELMRLGVPTLVVPRSQFRLEQSLRAQRIGDTGEIDWETIEHFDARRLRAFVSGALRTWPRPCSLDLGGVSRTADEITAQVQRPVRRVAHRRSLRRAGASA